MCGIAGHFGFAVPPRRAAACLGELTRRGPDGTGSIGWDPAGRRDDVGPHAFLHTRLAIRDVRDVASQPMSNATGDVWITYNGEVFGWEPDAASLAGRGAPFRTTSDTEYVLRGYEAFGIEALLPKLRGMFAFALVDWRARKVTLVRDRIGIKSAVWFHDGTRFAFASTVRALLALLPAADRRLSREGIDAFLAHRYTPAPRTCYAGVHRLEPGERIEFEIDTGALRRSRWWRPGPARQRFAAAADAALAQQTVADRPVGIFLSGGIDSTAVACSLARQGFQRLVALTAAFPGSKLDESAAARALAQRIGLPHIAVEIPARIGDVFDRMIDDLDEPFADPASIPLWLLCREATRHVKVVLGGDGGDELFAGYKRYRAHLRTRWRRGLRLPIPTASALPERGAIRLLDEIARSWHDAYALRFSGFGLAERRALQPDADVQPTYWRGAIDAPGDDALDELIGIDFANYLPDYALRKSDLCAMAHGLEQRVPLLDHEVVEAAFAMPRAERFTKPPKLALAPLCPQLRGAGYDPFRAPKRGFNPPLAQWLRGDLAPRLDGLGARLADATGGQLAASAAQRFVDGYRAGDDRREEQVLQLLMLAESLAAIAVFARALPECA
jgi:asparagine synthase (glutamine-hydrolysing)